MSVLLTLCAFINSTAKPWQSLWDCNQSVQVRLWLFAERLPPVRGYLLSLKNNNKISIFGFPVLIQYACEKFGDAMLYQFFPPPPLSLVMQGLDAVAQLWKTAPWAPLHPFLDLIWRPPEVWSWLWFYVAYHSMSGLLLFPSTTN